MPSIKEDKTYPQRSEEPLVLSRDVALLQDLLDVLFRVLSLRGFLESIVGQRSLERLEFKSITSREEVRVVDSLMNVSVSIALAVIDIEDRP